MYFERQLLSCVRISAIFVFDSLRNIYLKIQITDHIYAPFIYNNVSGGELIYVKSEFFWKCITQSA